MQQLLFDDRPLMTISQGWDILLLDTYTELRDTLDEVERLRQSRTIYPEEGNVFTAFRMLEPKDIRVVILGQDPYHDGNATGLAFGCKNTISPSLIAIIEGIKRDYPTGQGTENTKYKVNRNLNYLAQQGVFLLNTILTVEEGRPLSHADVGWHDFTYTVIKRIASTRPDVIFLLWGGPAKAYKPAIREANILAMILEAEHPVAARRNHRVWNPGHFEAVNQVLSSRGDEIIYWL